MDHSKLDLDEYHSVACSLLEHTKQHLTTRALAKYALLATGNLILEGPAGGGLNRNDGAGGGGNNYYGGGSSGGDFSAADGGARSGARGLPRVLYIGGTAHNSDYLRDLMFHGFRSLLGDNLYEYNTPRYMYEWPSDAPSNQVGAICSNWRASIYLRAPVTHCSKYASFAHTHSHLYPLTHFPFVSFRFVSFRFVSFRFVSFRIRSLLAILLAIEPRMLASSFD